MSLIHHAMYDTPAIPRINDTGRKAVYNAEVAFDLAQVQDAAIGGELPAVGAGYGGFVAHW